MTTPEQLLAARHRRQILDHEAVGRIEANTPGREAVLVEAAEVKDDDMKGADMKDTGMKDAWVKDFVDRLAYVVRIMGVKR
jgi:hypothetical protein